MLHSLTFRRHVTGQPQTSLLLRIRKPPSLHCSLQLIEGESEMKLFVSLHPDPEQYVYTADQLSRDTHV